MTILGQILLKTVIAECVAILLAEVFNRKNRKDK